MVSKQVMTGLVVAVVLAAGPAAAQDQHQRARHREQSTSQPQQTAPQRPQQQNNRERAVPRNAPAPQTQTQRSNQIERRAEAPRVSQQPRRYAAPQVVTPRAVPPRAVTPQAVSPRVYQPRGSYGVYRGYVPRYDRGPARIIQPRVVTVVPYHPYVYRPSWSVGVFYGSNGYYPYGATPRAYYDPIPGRPYGGLRITDMPRDAQVFADGYYVGIVNDFDGVFQHLNLEAGPHHIEILLPGGYAPPVAFDVYIDPGRTTTYRAGY